MPLRLRLTLWYTLTLFIVLVAFAGALLWQQQRLALRRLDRELEDLAITASHVLADELEEGVSLEAAAGEAQEAVTVPEAAVAVISRDGQLLAADWNGLALTSPLSTYANRSGVWNEASGSAGWRVRVRAFDLHGAGVSMVLGMPLDEVVRERRQAIDTMIVAIPLVLLLAAAGGLWIAAIGLRPITQMAGKAAALPVTSMQDLGESSRSDELGQLARAFNGLVARLRAALATEQQFMADASHELRTPMSVIRSAAEVTLAREQRDEKEYRDALAIVNAQSQRVGRLVDDMLVLTRADAGGYPLRPEPLYFDELIAECCDTLRGVAAARHVTLAATPLIELPFVGDVDLLRRLLINLVQNAVQHSPSDGVVRVTATLDGDAVTVKVVDQGPGIAESDRERIFERFVQLDASRRAQGSGLGLPIARWIAMAHRGSLDVETSDTGGSTFRACVRPLDPI